VKLGCGQRATEATLALGVPERGIRDFDAVQRSLGTPRELAAEVRGLEATQLQELEKRGEDLQELERDARDALESSGPSEKPVAPIASALSARPSECRASAISALSIQ